MAKVKVYEVHAVGRRKTAVARVYLAKGNGKIVINKRQLKDYFPKGTDQYVVNQPLNLLNVADKFDFYVNVGGGGTTGRHDA